MDFSEALKRIYLCIDRLDEVANGRVLSDKDIVDTANQLRTYVDQIAKEVDYLTDY